MTRALKYFVEEAWENLRRGLRSSTFSVITIGTAFFVLGAFLLVSSNLERLLEAWSTTAEISVYLRDDIKPSDRDAVERMLKSSPVATGTHYVSKAEALARFKRDFSDLAPIADDFTQNPLPASFEARIRPDVQSREAGDALAAELARLAGVADVRYDRQWMDRLATIGTLVRSAGYSLASILILAAALTVANVVRLACYARRDEVEIMHLVGAPISYVRGPFIAEGILEGGAGAILALLALWLGFTYARAKYAEAAIGFVNLSVVSFLPVHICASILIGGMAVGCLGGFIGARTAEEGLRP